MSTITKLQSELAQRRGEWRAICDSTGLSYWWLSKLCTGRIREPGVLKVEALKRYIDANPIPSACSAKAIERATAGAVSRSDLRPDIWPDVVPDPHDDAAPPRKVA